MELDGPGGVGMYLFGEKQYVLYNMSDQTAPMTLRFAHKVSASGWRDLVRNKELSVKEETSFVQPGGPVITRVSLNLEPFTIAVVQAP